MPIEIPASTETSAIDAPAPELSFDSVYERLKILAHRQLSGNQRATLDTTALVHELYLRMDGRTPLTFQHAGQFFTYAAKAMRNLLINRARDRMRQKAGGEWAPVTLGVEDHAQLAIASAEQALAIDEALGQLEEKDARAARVFELRYFAGLVPEQIAEIAGITRRTADRDWRYACAFLANALR